MGRTYENPDVNTEQTERELGYCAIPRNYEFEKCRWQARGRGVRRVQIELQVLKAREIHGGRYLIERVPRSDYRAAALLFRCVTGSHGGSDICSRHAVESIRDCPKAAMSHNVQFYGKGEALFTVCLQRN